MHTSWSTVALALSLGVVVACGSSAALDPGGAAADPNDDAPPGATAPVGTPPAAGQEDYVPIAAKGPFDCPSVTPPPYRGAIGLAPAAGLSTRFQVTCATCHGDDGQGSGRYPAIAHLSPDAFRAAVRSGKNAMPAFSEADYPDAQLDSDLAALSHGVATATPRSEATWTDEQAAAAQASGLAAWRKPDAKGAACASCHTPDAIDLAMIGYTDATILRRALTHLSADDAEAVRTFVHAQRLRYGVKAAACDPYEWHVFQPGGAPLAGDGPAAQDEAFVEALKAQKLRVATGPIAATDLDAAWTELATLNVKRVPLATPMARWTEDLFNGPEHRSINDWITAVPQVPVDGRWYAAVDQYLANPTTDAMWSLVAMLEDKNTPATKHGYEKSVTFVAADSHATTKMGDGGDIGRVMDTKYQASLVASHFFRLELLGKSGWFDLPDVPLPSATFQADSMRRIGPAFQEDHCYNMGAPCDMAQFDWLPPLAQVELDRPQFERQAEALVDPWWTAGFLFDPSLLQSGGDVLHYWQGFNPEINFPRRNALEPFMFGVMLVRRAEFLERVRGGQTTWSAVFPRSAASALPAQGVLDTRFFDGSTGMPQRPNDGQIADIPAPELLLGGNIERVLIARIGKALASDPHVWGKKALHDIVHRYQGDLDKVTSSTRTDLAAYKPAFAASSAAADVVLAAIDAAVEVSTP